MRKRRNWAEDAAIWGIGLLTLAIGFPAAVYIHENVRVWEGSAVFVSLGLGVLPVLWYWRTRHYGWVAATVSSLLLGFSLMTAVFHGWQTQASLLLFVAMAVFLVVFFVIMGRFTHRVESVMREVGEELDGDPLFRREAHFRDDGQRITVYPRRRRLVVLGIAQAGILVATSWGLIFLSADNVVLRIALGLMVGLLLTIFLGTLFRLVIRRPSLVVEPNGLLDNGTLPWSGVGLIGWDEILAVMPTIGRHANHQIVGLGEAPLPRHLSY